jgi:hypothetical protein
MMAFFVLYHMLMVQSNDTLILQSQFYLGSLQSALKGISYLICYASYHILSLDTWRRFGQLFFVLSILNLSFSIIGLPMVFPIFFLICIFLVRLKKKKKNSKHIVIKLLPYAIGLIPFALPFFIKDNSAFKPFFSFIPYAITFGFLASFSSFQYNAYQSKRQGLFLFLYPLFVLFFTSSFIVFSFVHLGTGIHTEMIHFFRAAIIWLLLIYLFQQMVLPKPYFHGLSFILPLSFMILSFLKSSTAVMFDWLSVSLLLLLMIWFFLIEKRKQYVSVELICMPLNIISICICFYLSAYTTNPLKYLADSTGGLIALAIISILGIIRHAKKLKENKLVFRSVYLVLWILLFFTINPVKSISKPLYEKFSKQYEIRQRVTNNLKYYETEVKQRK